MKRLTSDKPVAEMGMLELAHNSCYIKDGKARYRDYSLDEDARVLTRKLLKDHADSDDAFTCDEDFDNWMVDYRQDGMDSTEGLIALFYRNLWAMADLRERLKEYEDTGLTAKECRSAVEKQKPKKPDIWGDGYDDQGNIIYDMYNCPNCGKSYEIDYDDYKYCPECGQRLNWR